MLSFCLMPRCSDVQADDECQDAGMLSCLMPRRSDVQAEEECQDARILSWGFWCPDEMMNYMSRCQDAEIGELML